MESLANHISAHPVGFFMVALVSLLCCAALFAWAIAVVSRRGRVRFAHVLTPRSYLFLYIAAGSAALLVTMLAFAELAEALDADEALGRFDELLAKSLYTDLPHSLLQSLAMLTRLGNVSTLSVIGVAVGLLLLYRKQHLLFWTWTIAVAGNGVLIRVLKSVFQRVRPLHDHGFVVEQGWSFPSGHASGSLVTYGMLAYLVVRRWRAPGSWMLAACLVATFLAVGFSRVFLQVHYFSDVLAGFVSGAAWMAICVTACEIVFAMRVPAVPSVQKR